MKNVKTVKPSQTLVKNEEVNATTLTSQPLVAKVEEVKVGIAALNENSNLKDVIATLNEIIAKLNETKSTVRNRGLESTREMTEDDAKRIMLGDLKDKSHKEAGETLGLSYGQIYSARKGYTFKVTYKAMIEAQKASK